MGSQGERPAKQMSAEVNLTEPPLDMHRYLRLQGGCSGCGQPEGGGGYRLYGETLKQVNPIRTTNRCY